MGGNTEDLVAKARVTLLPPLCANIDVVSGPRARRQGRDAGAAA